MSPPPEKVTQLLIAWNGGDKDALDKLLPIVCGASARATRCKRQR